MKFGSAVLCYDRQNATFLQLDHWEQPWRHLYRPQVNRRNRRNRWNRRNRVKCFHMFSLTDMTDTANPFKPVKRAQVHMLWQFGLVPIDSPGIFKWQMLERSTTLSWPSVWTLEQAPNWSLTVPISPGTWNILRCKSWALSRSSQARALPDQTNAPKCTQHDSLGSKELETLVTSCNMNNI